MRPLLRWAGRGLLILYVFLMIVVLGFRYWLIPNIDQWRQPINTVLSNLSQSDIHIGAIHAQWDGLSPEFILRNVTVGGVQSSQALHIPYMAMRLQWRSLFQGQIVFSYLRLDGLRLGLHRDAQQRLHLAGQHLADSTGSNAAESHFLTWLAQQQQVELANASLSWHDEWRGQPVVHLTQVHGLLQQKDAVLHYKMTAVPPPGLGHQLRLQGTLNRAQLEQERLSGTIYAQMQGLNAEEWQHWVHLPTALASATLDAQVWLQLSDSYISELALDLQIQDGVWQSVKHGRLSTKQLRVFTRGPWAAWTHYLESAFESQPPVVNQAVQFELYAAGVQWQDNLYFAEDLMFDELRLLAHTEPQSEQPVIRVPQLFLKNADLQLELETTITPDGADWDQAQWDLIAQAQQLQLNALYKYFPMPEIPAEVVEWLRESLVGGQMPEVLFKWRGNLADYPYQDPAKGIFYVGGPIQQAEIDYYPPSADEKGWPKIERLDGVLMLRGSQLWIQNGRSELKPDQKAVVQAQAMQLEINDFSAAEPLLTLSAQTEGAAQAYLGLMTHSDLGGLLDHAFNQTQATGQWRVPLEVRVNLEQTEQIQVAGQIEFDQNTLRILPWLPPLEHLQGRLQFDEQGAQAQDIKARWLGGPVTIQRRIGAAQQALLFKGELQLEALAQQTKLEALDHYLDGSIPYQLEVGLDENLQFFVQAQSQLQGLSSSLPAPLNKAASQAWPLTLQWAAANPKQHALRGQLGSELALYLLESPQSHSLFEKGYLTWQRPAPKVSALPAGLQVDIEHPQLDLDQWQQVIDHFEAPETAAADNAAIALHSVRIKAKQAYALDGVLKHLTFTSQQNQPRQWRSDISSEQVAGTVWWQENEMGQVQGVVDAEFQRVHWQPKPTETAAAQSEVKNFKLDLADLNLRIAEFSYDSLRLGSVVGVGRRSLEDHSLWHIQQLDLAMPDGVLQAQGGWRTEGPQRGLDLELSLSSENLGALLDYVGFSDVLAEGQGYVRADLNWYQLPWSTAIDNLQADVEFELERGRLNQLQSNTGKLLEFLSLQSISRLATLGTDLKGLLQNGFPFDQIAGQVQLNQQILRTKNFTVLGPVGTILLEGDIDLGQESLDVNAVVVPRMDMSGAALAAGIALNPVVGISAFLTQWLLKEPLAKAMTVQYHLSGPWDQLQSKELKLHSAPTE